jgi:thymidylate synthase
MKREELIKWVFQSTDLKCIGTKKHRYVLGFPFNIASYATLAKILEEITLFVALESKVI